MTLILWYILSKLNLNTFIFFAWKAEGIATTETGAAKETTDGATSKANGRAAEVT